ncbi:hypothetical protein [Tunturibacter empetritectus]|uniref:Uncharacterized protein n=1 Tax=Tunturiibacter lichenicola TaxID=2051959 RepID=A0A7W8J5R9_9BACT|nr:hypothetical protein [Edaphobacter lichenicola]MBB5343030.1 hypothetical protein [Edaphobacter lichenicola]
MKIPRASFSYLLPLFSLGLWIVLVAVPVTLIYLSLQQEAHGSNVVRMQFGEFTQVISRSHFLTFALKMGTLSKKAHLIEAVNLPAFAVDLLISRLSGHWPMGWTPSGFMPEQWNALSFPFYCLPFWWFVGTGFDAVFSHKRLRWPSMLVGTLLCGFCLFLLFGLRFAISVEEREGMTYPFWGFGFWVALFAIFPVAWFRQRKIFRLMRGANAAS